MPRLRRRSNARSPQAATAADRSHDEAALLGRIAEGEPEEPLGALYDRYAASIHGLGLRLLGDRGMAEELVQDTFVRLWRAAPRFDPARASVRTFVFEIARRAAIDLRRRASVRPGLARGDHGDQAGETDSTDSDIDRLVLEMAMSEALEGLSDEHRETLELHYREDLSQRDIAKRLDVPVGTVKTRAFYGLKALRQALEEREVVG